MSARAPGIAPVPSLWRRLDAGGRLVFPFATACLLVLIFAAPLGLPGESAMRPAFALCCTAFWTLHRPASMRPLAVFALGLLADLLGQAPLGVGMVGLLLCQGLALRWRRALLRQDFLVHWLACCGLAVVYAALVWLLCSLFALRLLPPAPALFQAALAAGAYPLLALAFLVANRGLADPDLA
jgi:rod shape-determining protein MreD